jgi:hypothetical protein
MPGNKGKSPPGLKNIVVLRATDEWTKWLDELAEADSALLTATIEQALKDFGEKLNVRKPPRRVP